MDFIVLSKVTGILGPFAWIFGLIMNYVYEFLNFVGIPNVGLTIILFTLIVNIILLPLTVKQQRFTRVSNLVQPELQKVQKKYKGKSDEVSQRRLQAETMEIYKKYGANPTSGCLPMLIQFPILIAMYRIIYNIPSYVNSLHSLFLTIAEPISKTAGGAAIMEKVMSDLGIKVSGFDFNNIEKIIDVLNNVKTTNWDAFASAFSGSPDVIHAIDSAKNTIININSLPGGLNIVDAPVHFSQGISGIFPGILIPILAGVTQYISVKITTPNAPKQSEQQDGMAANMKMMNTMMPLISVWICFTLPTGVGLYWIFNAVFRTLGIVIVNKFFMHKNIEELVKENEEKIAESKVRKGSSSQTVVENGKQQRTLGDIAKANLSKKEYKPSDYTSSDPNAPVNTGSISSVAHMLDRSNKDE